VIALSNEIGCMLFSETSFTVETFTLRTSAISLYVGFTISKKGYSNSQKNMHIDKMHVKLEYQLSSGMRGRL